MAKLVNLIIIVASVICICWGFVVDEPRISLCSAIFLVVAFLFGLFCVFVKKEAERVTFQKLRKDNAQKLGQQVKQDNEAEKLANLEGFDKYYELRKTAPREDVESLMKLSAAIETSVYQEKEKKVYLADVDTMVKTIVENQEIRERNKKAREWARKETQPLRDLATSLSFQAPPKERSTDKYVNGKQIDTTHSTDELFSCFKFSNKYATADANTGALTISVDWSQSDKRCIDGSFVALFYGKNHKCVGCAYLPLPIEGARKHSGNLRGICANPTTMLYDKVVIAPYKLWEVIPEGYTVEKTLKAKHSRKVGKQRVLKDIASYRKSAKRS